MSAILPSVLRSSSFSASAFFRARAAGLPGAFAQLVHLTVDAPDLRRYLSRPRLVGRGLVAIGEFLEGSQQCRKLRLVHFQCGGNRICIVSRSNVIVRIAPGLLHHVDVSMPLEAEMRQRR